jgi:hypothetical protein
MNKYELVQSLIDGANSLPHRDDDALDKLIKRSKMILKNIGKEKPYVAELLNIDFHPNFGPADEKDFDEYWISGIKKMLNLLNTILEELKLFGDGEVKKIPNVQFSNRIFIVHGHYNEMKVEVELTLKKLDLEPIILHEQPDKGRTIIEKFTEYSDVNYAIILLSPDDYGYSKEESPKKVKSRARQNVIFELGFFLGKLGRESVLVIYKENNNFEFPSDYSGVLYKPYNKSGNWKFQIVKELQALGYKVSADKLLKA